MALTVKEREIVFKVLYGVELDPKEKAIYEAIFYAHLAEKFAEKAANFQPEATPEPKPQQLVSANREMQMLKASLRRKFVYVQNGKTEYYKKHGNAITAAGLRTTFTVFRDVPTDKMETALHELVADGFLVTKNGTRGALFFKVK